MTSAVVSTLKARLAILGTAKFACTAPVPRCYKQIEREIEPALFHLTVGSVTSVADQRQSRGSRRWPLKANGQRTLESKQFQGSEERGDLVN